MLPELSVAYLGFRSQPSSRARRQPSNIQQILRSVSRQAKSSVKYTHKSFRISNTLSPSEDANSLISVSPRLRGEIRPQTRLK
jgi:hypothetical protein